MPAAEELPNLDRFVRAYHGALVSERRHGDTHVGSIHSHWARLGAVMWSRQTERVAEEFRALYFGSAKNERFDAYLAGHFINKSRIEDSLGEGVVKLTRPNAGLGAGMFWAKTRIAVGGVSSDPLRHYYVKNDTSCGATDLVCNVAVEASAPGPKSKIQVSAGERAVLRIDDPLWDNTWAVQELRVTAGTLREEDDEARARISTELFEERLGYESAIIKIMKDAGAGTVVLFRSDFPSEVTDYGLNKIYVGDDNFETSAELLRACRLALPSVVMAGAGNQALPMTNSWLGLTVTVRFWDSPEKFGMASASENTKAAVTEYFESRENQFLWDLEGIGGAVRRAVEDTQNIAITATQSAPSVATLFNSFPLRRFRTSPERVNVILENPLP